MVSPEEAGVENTETRGCLPSVVSLKVFSSSSVGHSATKSFGPSHVYSAPITGINKYHNMQTGALIKYIFGMTRTWYGKKKNIQSKSVATLGSLELVLLVHLEWPVHWVGTGHWTSFGLHSHGAIARKKAKPFFNICRQSVLMQY